MEITNEEIEPWNNFKYKIIVGDWGRADLYIKENGYLNSHELYVGHNRASSNGRILINGAGSYLENVQKTNNSIFIIGGLGNGSIEMDHGARLFANTTTLFGTETGSSGFLYSNNNSEIVIDSKIIVGDKGEGRIQLSNGSSLKIKNNPLILGNSFESRSRDTSVYLYKSLLEVDGELIVGNEGRASITNDKLSKIITKYYMIASTDSQNNYGSKSVGTVSVSTGSILMSTGGVSEIGSTGDGTLDIFMGGKVYNQGTVIGRHETGRGRVSIYDADSSLYDAKEITLGGTTSGEARSELVVFNGGSVLAETINLYGKNSHVYVGVDSNHSVTPGHFGVNNIIGKGNGGNLHFRHNAKDYLFLTNISGNIKLYQE